MLHQEVGAVLLGSDRIRRGFGHALHDLHVDYIEFVAAGSALVGADLALDDHARFLRQVLIASKTSGRNGVLGDDALNDSGAIAKLRKQQFPALAQVVEPAADGDRLAVVLADFCDGSNG